MSRYRRTLRQGHCAQVLERLEERRLLATFTVTSNGDVPVVMGMTLRQAITAANLNPGADTITFNIAGVPTIHPLIPLPAVTGSTTIDGTTQPGYAGTPIVFIDGTATIPLAAPKDGLAFTGGSSVVKALDISGFGTGGSAGIRLAGVGSHQVLNSYVGPDPTGTAPGTATNFDGIVVESDGNALRGNLISNNFDTAVLISGDATVTGNRIGTDAAGTTAFPNGDAILVQGASNTRIGGATTADRNIISGNTSDGVRFEDAGSGNVVTGNYIGVDITGSAILPNNGRGVAVEAVTTPQTTDVSITDNVISGNDGGGVEIINVSGVSVQGNKIGTDVSGAAVISNSGNGVLISGDASSNTLQGNIASGNFGDGVRIQNGASANVVIGNFIGTDASGTASLGNAGNGVTVDGSDNQIGTPASGNSIGDNGESGVVVTLSDANVRNAIRGNNIFYNELLGIDLGDDGVTPNDPMDVDSGPNEFQNYPVLTAVSLAGSSATISGTLNSTPSSTFVIDFFASEIWDTTTFGEGQKYLGSTTVTTDAAGNASFTATVGPVPSGYRYFAATATDSVGNSSEFSYDPTPGNPLQRRPVALPPPPSSFAAPTKLVELVLESPTPGPLD